MSEYQYYEFQALDKPLTKQQQKELRSLSSRAEITATSFVNEYNYGDFRGGPQELMERHFDAFCYVANWGTRRLMFRLPKTVLDAQTARRYCHSDAASVTETADHVIIDLCLERDPDDEWLEGSGLLAGMVQARSDLAAGDLRLLYLVSVEPGTGRLATARMVPLQSRQMRLRLRRQTPFPCRYSWVG